MTNRTYERRTGIRRPRVVATSYHPRTVAEVYHYPLDKTGAGYKVGLVELGGGFDPAAYPGRNVKAVLVAGGSNTPDGPRGADGEVQLDIGVVVDVAPGAEVRVYLCPNTDDGFLAGIQQSAAECDVVSISWGGPESQWRAAAITKFSAAFKAARAAGVPVFAAAGDTGSDDGTGRPTCDYPASDPSVIGCGGTRLLADATSSRLTETVWNDSATSATGGGVSKVFAGRKVPDVAADADPETGYYVTVDGETDVIGGTSAVAPLYAALHVLLLEATGGHRFDFLNTIATNPGVCFDVTSGSNGAYRAGPGRDQTTGFGVVDGAKLLAVLLDQIPDPVPPGAPAPTGALEAAVKTLVHAIPADWLAERHVSGNHAVQVALKAFLADAAVSEATR